MRRSNTPFLKLPNFTQAQSIVNEEKGESFWNAKIKVV